MWKEKVKDMKVGWDIVVEVIFELARRSHYQYRPRQNDPKGKNEKEKNMIDLFICLTNTQRKCP